MIITTTIIKRYGLLLITRITDKITMLQPLQEVHTCSSHTYRTCDIRQIFGYSI